MRTLMGHAIWACMAVLVGIASIGWAAPARADDIGYLVNVTMRPGYHFADSSQALAYGHGICDKIAGGRPYGQIVADVQAEVGTDDDFQASYLIGQAADELCPEQIWQLRQSAGGYRPSSH